MSHLLDSARLALSPRYLARRLPEPWQETLTRGVNEAKRRSLVLDRALGRPTVFHVTHWKAGSQWVKALLNGLAYRRVMPNLPHQEQLFKQPLLRGAIYAASYVSRPRFESLDVPADHRAFVVIRDLRDALVSYYFSMRYSHPLITDYVRQRRQDLQGVAAEEGLLRLLSGPLTHFAKIQRSWLDTGVEILRYEDLLGDTAAGLRRMARIAELPVSERRIRAVVRLNAFERMSGGRRRGQENPHSFFRKGVAGDWRAHFTPAITRAFKERYGELLVQTGYETDLDW